MKILLSILVFVLSAGLTFGQEEPLLNKKVSKSEEISDEMYENITNDMCSCFNAATKGISVEMRKVIEDAGENGTNLGEDIGFYFENTTNNIEEDIAILSEMGGDELMGCINILESKYQDIDMDSAQEQLMEIFQKTDGCGLTYAFMLEGLKQ